MGTKHRVEMQRVEQVNGTDIVDILDLRVKKYNRTVAVIDGNFRVVKDLGNSYEFRVTVAHSSLGNNQFNEYPMKIPQAKACDVLNGTYREYQQYWANDTSLPIVTEAGLCPFPKGDYWIRNWLPSSEWIPSVVPDGYWRLSLDILNGDGMIECQVRYFVRLTRNFM
ncbi:uncharacterized protein LOC129763100 [Toxorhynchites rutilus septentrionalis]|uniref:uncharacterized protein LOC129763100 n=1 Tax=Toxorhynchites rutilus septentrionalis TaxID=329112 RepID=UPI00247869B6|nr:uncharacterized protein LOC129763100 [Toxorhynchites rutilus septentrionalis]